MLVGGDMPIIISLTANEMFLLQDDEPPEITYCVVDSGGSLTLQAMTPTQPMPAADELNSKFAELVVNNANFYYQFAVIFFKG